ncbi:MAG: Rieske (2Fe-2S) protein [Bacteroidota bacterium]
MKTNINPGALSRRQFFSYLTSLIAIPAVSWWLMVGRRKKEMAGGGDQIVIGKQLPSGVSFIGSAILVKEGEQLSAFEGKCTHLGCSIKKIEGKELVCQCHGSRFDFSGRPVKGPASSPLRELEIVREANGNYVIMTD